ncbi:MAG: BT4734/BF3469 family protein [Bacteroidales bacterium]|nr:BT4734/BF3469 family protein [Bacteroidales bacterium]MDD4683965.1 BT4734/BF3469 family protein [Bacteroidales bacterium]
MEKLKTPTEGLSSVNVNGLKRFQLWHSKFAFVNKECIDDCRLLEILKENAIKEKYVNLRQFYSSFIETGDLENYISYESVKDKLEYITLSCLMKSKRKAANMIVYNERIILDLDFKDNMDKISGIEDLKRQFGEDAYTRMAFLSPNGMGLKIIVDIVKDSRIEEINKRLLNANGNHDKSEEDVAKISTYHNAVYKQVKVYYESKFGLKFDNSAKGVQGAAYVSADSNPYFNENAELFLVSDISLEKPAPEVKYTVCDCINNSYTTTTRSKAPEYTTSHCDILLEMVQWFEKYTKGRHNMIVKVTPQATTYSIPKSVIVNFFTELYEGEDFTIAEVERTVNDLYNQQPKINQYIITELYDKGCRAIKTT